MNYVSTRGTAPRLGFEDVMLAGLARDGGLYVPESWPHFAADELRAMRGLDYAALAGRVMRPFVGGAIDDATFDKIVRETYAAFRHDAVAPLKQLGPNEWVMELFHGPTLAFKDFALQLLGRLFDHVLEKRGERVTIVGATSGDTGSAAIEAFRDRANVDIVILHPYGRTSEVQRRQMTTVQAANVHNVALDGTFDDCQDLVKAMFADAAFRDEMRVTAVNSINWARVMAQVVYYVHASLALGGPDRPVAFSVPTGNFGDVYAGYVAARSGLPVAQLTVATNANDILARFFKAGDYSIAQVLPTLSPSMDIQVSSNFERLLFDMKGRDGVATGETVRRFRETGRLEVSDGEVDTVRDLFAAETLDDEQTIAEIGRVFAHTGELVDPHTAVGIGAGRACRRDPAIPLVCLATAHPAKFPDAVEKATGRHPALPPHIADLFEREERYDRLANDADALKTYIRRKATGA